jgi:hypothetical protein
MKKPARPQPSSSVSNACYEDQAGKQDALLDECDFRGHSQSGATGGLAVHGARWFVESGGSRVQPVVRSRSFAASGAAFSGGSRRLTVRNICRFVVSGSSRYQAVPRLSAFLMLSGFDI